LGGRLRVAINAQVRPGSGAGGVETVLRVLTALGQLGDGDEEYVFVGPWDEPDWLKPLMGTGQTIVPGPKPTSPPPSFIRRGLFNQALNPLRPAVRRFRQLLPASNVVRDEVPTSDGFYERLNCDVIHFPFQEYVRCALPAVYNPHDLQHLHFPHFFSPEETRQREQIYGAGCREAHTVIVASQFVRQDVERGYGVATEKIQVIPWAPLPLEDKEASPYDDARALQARIVRSRYGVGDEPFALYPAVTWEHKNHIRLLEALALLRDRDGLRLRLVCTGHQNHFWPRIEQRLAGLRLEGQVSFLGVVAHEELSALYRAAQFVVVPTLFEAASAPLFESWQHDAPVACSAVTSLPEQAGDAALLFDPLSVEAIAAAVSRMATDHDLRLDLRRRGTLRLQDFSCERTLKAYRAVYRRAAGLVPCEEDRWLLSRDWTTRESPTQIHTDDTARIKDDTAGIKDDIAGIEAHPRLADSHGVSR
jgi:glycosyltransferase involved in cell wall biosynthesis